MLAAFDEAISAHANQLWISAGMMMRKTPEEILDQSNPRHASPSEHAQLLHLVAERAAVDVLEQAPLSLLAVAWG